MARVCGGGAMSAQTVDAAALLVEFFDAFAPDPVQAWMLGETLIAEEAREVADAHRAGDRLALAGECADLVYVTYYAAYARGAHVETVVSTLPAKTTYLPAAQDAIADDVDSAAAAAVRALREDRPAGPLAFALACLAYQTRRLAAAHGIVIDTALGEVHRANLSKLMPDGTALKRPDGKVLKGPNYQRADLRCALLEQHSPAA